jgi:hypothetical protein
VQIVLTPIPTTSGDRRVKTLAPGSLTRIKFLDDYSYLFRVNVKNVSGSPILQSNVILTISDKKVGPWVPHIVANERLPNLAPREVASVVFVGHWQLPYRSHSSVRVALRPGFAKPRLYPVTFRSSGCRRSVEARPASECLPGRSPRRFVTSAG